MLHQIAADAGPVRAHFDTERDELSRWSDAASHQQRWTVDRAGADDYMCGAQFFTCVIPALAADDARTDCERAVEQHVLDERSGANLEVRTGTHSIVEIADRRRDAFAGLAHRDRSNERAVLPCAVLIVAPHVAARGERAEHRAHEG